MQVAGKSLASFSVQQILDCAMTSDGCVGGDPSFAYEYLIRNNVRLAYSYPYTSSGLYKDCAVKEVPEYISGLIVESYDRTKMVGDENAMMNYVSSTSPLGACVSANDAWQHYQNGVMPASSCESTPLNHCVQIVSLDIEEGWWRVKNSWSVDWGESGFIRCTYICIHHIHTHTYIYRATNEHTHTRTHTVALGTDTCGITGEPHTVTISTPVSTKCGDTVGDDCGATSTCTETTDSTKGTCTCSAGATNPPTCTDYASYLEVESVPNIFLRDMISFYVGESKTQLLKFPTWLVICITFGVATLLTFFFFECFCCIRSKIQTNRTRRQFEAMDHYYSELDDEVLSSPPSDY